MNDSLINTLARRCSNCSAWSKMEKGEHTGYCDRIGGEFAMRFCFQEKEHIPLKAKSVDYAVCDLHTFVDYNQE